MSVDFPAPFSPTRAWISPDRKVRSTESFATTPGKRLVIPSSLIRGASSLAAFPSSASEARPPPLSVTRSSARFSSSLGLRRHLYLAVDDLLLELVELGLDVLGQEPGVVVVLVHRVPDSILCEPEHLGAGLEGVLSRLLDCVVDGGVDALEHRGKDQLSLLAARGERLVGIDADGELFRLHRGLEEPGPRRAGRVIDDVGPAVVHLCRQRLALSGVVEGGRRVTDVLDEDLDVGVHFSRSRLEAGLEALDEPGALLAPEEADGPRLGLERRSGADQKGAFLLLEREVGDVGGFLGESIHYGEVDVWIIAGDLVDARRERKPDRHDDVVALV